MTFFTNPGVKGPRGAATSRRPGVENARKTPNAGSPRRRDAAPQRRVPQCPCDATVIEGAPNGAILTRRPVCRTAQNDYVRAMEAVTSRPLPGRPLAIPNLLTYARIVAVPLVVACLYVESILDGGLWLRWVAV